MVLVMLERVASYQLPGSPLLRHVLEVVKVIEILVAKLMSFSISREKGLLLALKSRIALLEAF